MNCVGKKFFERDQESNAKIKNQDVKARFVTSDNDQSIFMVNDDKEIHESYDSAIWISSKFFVNTLDDMFTSVWKVKK